MQELFSLDASCLIQTTSHTVLLFIFFTSVLILKSNKIKINKMWHLKALRIIFPVLGVRNNTQFTSTYAQTTMEIYMANTNLLWAGIEPESVLWRLRQLVVDQVNDLFLHLLAYQNLKYIDKIFYWSISWFQIGKF